MIFLLYRDVRAEYIFREHWNDVFECIKKNVIRMTRTTFSRKIFESRIWRDVLKYWWLWCFDAQCLSMRWEQQKKKLELYDKENSFYNEQRLFSWYSRCLKTISDNDIEFCLHRCDESTTWLIEKQTRDIEFKLITKISVLNELNSLLNLRRSRFLIDQLTEFREDTFICMWLKFFLNCLSAFLSKYDFFAVSRSWWFEQRLFFENVEMMFLNVWKKTLLIWCEKRLLKKFSKQKLKLDILNY